jgi:hypothetical protein
LNRLNDSISILIKIEFLPLKIKLIFKLFKMKKSFVIFLFFFASAAVIINSCRQDEEFFSQDAEKLTLKNSTFPEPVETALDQGIVWLLTQQNPAGSFGPWGEEVAKTALAVTKLCDRSVELGSLPLDGPYASEIQMGLNYIFVNAQNNPDGGIYLSTNFGHSVYNTGIAMMAVAAARCLGCEVSVPSSVVDGYTFEQVLQANVDYFIAAQNPDGGWRYVDHSEPSDNSNTGFAVLGLMAAEGAGITIPQDLKVNLSTFIDAIQDDVTGGSMYALTYPIPWINVMKTGNLLFEMAFVGDNPDDSRVQAALDYIETNWDATGTGDIYDVGWHNPDNYLAMYCLMKGFVAMGIDEIEVGGIPVNWYDEFVAEILEDTPFPLPSNPWIDAYLSSVFSLLTLEKITPVPYLMVDVDVKPEDCPNPLNVKAKGILPIAILGTEDFDVSEIDPSTVTLAGVSPVRWSWEDVTSPPVDIPGEDCECVEVETPDGFIDLALKFKNVEVIAALGEVMDGEIIQLEVEGELFDGTLIKGKDCVTIELN